MNISVQSWQDFINAQPLDIKSIVANAFFGGQGTFKRSTTFLQAGWVNSPYLYTGNNTTLVSLDGTDASTTTDAAQWAFSHQMVNTAAALPLSLRKVAFLRAGKIWENQIEIALGGSNYTDVQLSFRDNAGTSGSFLNGAAGAVPVISFPGTLTGNVVLHVTILQPGTYSMVLIGLFSGNYNAFEMEWVVLP